MLLDLKCIDLRCLQFLLTWLAGFHLYHFMLESEPVCYPVGAITEPAHQVTMHYISCAGLW